MRALDRLGLIPGFPAIPRLNPRVVSSRGFRFPVPRGGSAPPEQADRDSPRAEPTAIRRGRGSRLQPGKLRFRPTPAAGGTRHSRRTDEHCLVLCGQHRRATDIARRRPGNQQRHALLSLSYQPGSRKPTSRRRAASLIVGFFSAQRRPLDLPLIRFARTEALSTGLERAGSLLEPGLAPPQSAMML